MNRLLQSMTNTSFTQNGAATNASSCSACLDLFAAAGSARNMSQDDLCHLFEGAFREDAELASRTLLWLRDIRGGAGERKAFGILLRYLAFKQQLSESFVKAVPRFGTWKDLLVLFDTPAEETALKVIAEALRHGDALCAKWMPRTESSMSAQAHKIRKYMGLGLRAYRKMLVNATRVVESQMCANEWDQINYSHVPSQAMRRYKNAFPRHSPDRWLAYLTALESGETKVSANAIFPHEIIGKSIYGYNVSTINEAQWNALPNWLADNDERILPLVDVSGSMHIALGQNSSYSCLSVAISLGLYISERANGSFKDYMLTFSETPVMHHIQGRTLGERIFSVAHTTWGMSTNLEGAFSALLQHAKKVKAPAQDMPTLILILSDMEFNLGVQKNETALESIKRQYSEAGYTLPNIVFWNLNARLGNMPALMHDENVALISGYSPSILKSLLTGKYTTPMEVFLQTVMAERYSI